MARSVRVEFAGAFYHVMARGNRRKEKKGSDLVIGLLAHPANTRLIADARSAAGLQSDAWPYR